MTFRIHAVFAAIVVVVTGASQQLSGQTTFNGGEVISAASWSNGLPSVGNNGTIATNGTMTGVVNFNKNITGTVSINITGGTLTTTSPIFFNGPSDTSTGWTTFQ